MEHGTVDASGTGLFTSTVGTVTADTGIKRSGAYSLKAVSAAGQSNVQPVFTGGTTGVTRFSMYISALPSIKTNIAWLSTAGGQYGNLFLNANGTLSVDFDNAGSYGSTDGITTLTTGKWYTIDLRLDPRATSNWMIDWRVGGVVQPQASYNVGVAGAQVTQASYGLMTNASGATIYLDDMAISTSANDYPIVGGKVLGYKPTGVGTNNIPTLFDYSTNNGGAWSTLSGETTPVTPGSAQYINDWPVLTGGSATLVRETGATPAAYLEYALADTGESVSPRAVRFLAAARDPVGSGSVDNSITLTAELAGSTSLAINTDPSLPGAGTSVHYHGGILNTAPGGVSWTVARLNSLNLRIGGGAAITNPWFDAIMVEAEFPDSS
jgi:hypothetical protein